MLAKYIVCLYSHVAPFWLFLHGALPAMLLTCLVLSPSASSSPPWPGYHSPVPGFEPAVQHLEGSGSLSAWTLLHKNLTVPDVGRQKGMNNVQGIKMKLQLPLHNTLTSVCNLKISGRKLGLVDQLTSKHEENAIETLPASPQNTEL